MMTGAPLDKRLSHHADLEGHEDRIMERAANLKKRVFFLLAPFGIAQGMLHALRGQYSYFFSLRRSRAKISAVP
jgi:hypothetical protein